MPTLIAVFLFTLPLVVIGGNDDPASLPQGVWLQVAVLLLWTVHLARPKTAESRAVSPIFWPVAAFLVWAALSTLWAIDPFASQRVLLRWFAAAGLAFLIANTIESTVQERRLIVALFGASVVVAGVGLLQYLGGFDLVPQAFPPAGTMGNKNVAAAFVAAMAPVGVMGLATAASAAPFFSMALGVALAFVLHTGCRAAWLALLAQLLVGLVLVVTGRIAVRWTSARVGAVGWGALVLAILAVQTPASSGTGQGTVQQLLLGGARPLVDLVMGNPGPGALQAPQNPSHEARAERSVALRLAIWRNTLTMVKEAPLAGVGIGNFQVHYPRFAGSAVQDGTQVDERVESAHNDYVQLMAELGLVGVLLFALALFAMARSLVLRKNPVEDRGLEAAVWLGLVALFVGASVSATVTQPVALATAATLLGVTMGRGLSPSPLLWAAEEDRGSGFFRARSLGVVGTAALLVVACSWGFAQIRADRHVLTMAYAEARGDWPGVVREGLMARRVNPMRSDPRFATASAMLRLGHTAEAALILQEVTSVDPYNGNALGNLGIAFLALGDIERAITAFEQVLAIRPDDRNARALMREARTRQAGRLASSD